MYSIEVCQAAHVKASLTAHYSKQDKFQQEKFASSAAWIPWRQVDVLQKK